MDSDQRTIWTIGHSTHTWEHLVSMLRSFSIGVLADIRTYPGSRRYPHFNREAMEAALPLAGITYIHMPALGGRRKPLKHSKNTMWRNEGFRGYADYMETPDFADAAAILADTATQKRTAMMCSEAVWWSCHRALVSDFLKWKGWTVMHISAPNKASEHPYTSAARFSDGRLHYRDAGLF